MPPGSRARPAPRTSVWLAGGPSRHRAADAAPDHPGALDRARITTVTVRLLDEEGLAKFSMRRLASELGVTAMSLYWYVDSRDDLLELALDAVQGEIALPRFDDGPQPDAAPADRDDAWREQLRDLASEYRRMLVGHPWVSPMIGQYLNVGPQAMEFAAAAQQVMLRAGLPPGRLTGALSAVFQFVYGFGAVEANWNARCRSSGMDKDAYYAYIHRQVEGRPEYAQSLELREVGGSGTVDGMRQQDFDTAVELLVAGIEALRSGPAARS
ncbi:TetR/AcrR family transcriptional regulator [Streptomyces sp. 549]|uniref:TetR/AcrR family transcriptional regulator n=1 Tax=Streptomyces sp. 549 TaxID=3049076 RepID=UPI0024C2906D|nr:TetR/AcrR family transcriptional regulator [Streptomyces sp. 549]MDK1474943.1 TetR/AcrR family transcriptional regulator [Streptomyces sp. 549]